LYVQTANGAVQSFALNKVRKLTFTEEAMYVHPTSGSATSVPYTDIVKLAFAPIVGSAPSDEPSAVAASAQDYGVKIYPNPTVDNVVIESTTDIREVRVFDAQGTLLQLVDNQQVTTTLSLSALPAGVYLVRIVNGQGVCISKIVKQ
jgi:type IV secretory pathway TraG/TraD family ATPase VirD4